jgi:hypothetical protein
LQEFMTSVVVDEGRIYSALILASLAPSWCEEW